MIWEDIARKFWENGLDVPFPLIREWLSTDIDFVDVLSGFIYTHPWEPVIAANQLVLHVKEPRSILEKLREINVHPLSFFALMRRERASPEVLLVKVARGTELPKHHESAETPQEFFLNVMRYEFGVDVEEILRPLKEVVGEYTDEVLRLIDVDLVVTPEQLRERVERALEILALAKEQGLEIGDVVSEWDRLADEGGERLEKLPMAVRRVAEQNLNKELWKLLRDKLQEKGIKVVGDGGDIVRDLFYLELVNMDGNVDASQFMPCLDKLAMVLRKYRPVPVFLGTDVEKVLRIAGLGRILKKEHLEAMLDVLCQLSRRALLELIEGKGKGIVDPVFEALEREKAIEPSIVEEALLDLARGIPEEDVRNFLAQRLQT